MSHVDYQARLWIQLADHDDNADYIASWDLPSAFERDDEGHPAIIESACLYGRTGDVVHVWQQVRDSIQPRQCAADLSGWPGWVMSGVELWENRGSGWFLPEGPDGRPKWAEGTHEVAHGTLDDGRRFGVGLADTPAGVTQLPGVE